MAVISRSIAPVDPDPQNSTTCSSPAPTAARMISRASSRKPVVCRPVPELSVWVLPYRGSTAVRIRSSMKSSERPDAV